MAEYVAITDLVHYRSYGTPGGEFAPACRAAVVTEVGAWITVATEKPESFSKSEGRPIRFAEQWFFDDAVSLHVLNPTGDFLHVCRHDGLPPRDKILTGERSELRGGTWHHADECPG
jgi:hypothetical protein